MWQFAIYIIVFILLILLLRHNGYTWPSTLVISSVFALIIVSLFVRINPLDAMRGNQETAIYFVIAILTLLFVVIYAFYKALSDKQ